MSELKPCPFCGGNAELRFFNNGSSFSFRVECLNCTAMVGRRVPEYSTKRTFWFGTKREAIDAWNAREDRTCEDYIENDLHYYDDEAPGFPFVDMKAME